MRLRAFSDALAAERPPPAPVERAPCAWIVASTVDPGASSFCGVGQAVAAHNRHGCGSGGEGGRSRGVVRPDSLRHLWGGTSSIRSLGWKGGCLDAASFAELVRRIQTNSRVETYALRGGTGRLEEACLSRSLLDHCRRTTFTIRRLTCASPLQSRRYGHVFYEGTRGSVRDDYRRAVAAAGPAHVDRRQLWPEASIGRFGAFPTLVYRYLRWNGSAAAVGMSSSSSSKAVELNSQRRTKRPAKY
jgi:hypothetical protein